MVSTKLEGGLGNQLFIMSHLYAHAKKHGLDYCVPTNVNNPHIKSKDDPRVQIREAYIFPGIKYFDTPKELDFFVEPFFHYQEIPKLDNVCFSGFWQSWKYFDEYRDDLLKAFAFKWKPKINFCSIHVRRDDYLKWPEYHPPVTEEYLREAIHLVYDKKPETTFKFYSDDIHWCKQFVDSRVVSNHQMFEFSEGKNEIDDMADASRCENNIGSNSSFSWWIHYLNRNPDKIGIFPSKWFGPLLNHDTKDLYLPTSVVI